MSWLRKASVLAPSSPIVPTTSLRVLGCSGMEQSFRISFNSCESVNVIYLSLTTAWRQTHGLQTTSRPWKHRQDRKRFLVASYTPHKHNFATASTSSVVVPYQSLTVGIPRETFPNERRVAITPQNVALLLKKGFSRVLIESGAGAEAQFTDEAYRKAGAIIVERDVVWSQSDIFLKIRAPSIEDGTKNEVNSMREGATIISFLYPAQNKPVVEALAGRGITSFAMDKIPRISRAQVFDALRSVDI